MSQVRDGGFAIPRGRLVRSRVVADVGDALAAVLDRGLSGYAVLDPGAQVLGDDARGVLTFEDGVPVLAYCEATDCGGTEALADLSTPGPYGVDLYELPPDALATAHEATDLRVPPGMPAEDLAADPDLAARTRDRAPADRQESEPTAVEAFLADEERIAAIREETQAEARARAAEWGLADELAEE